MFAALQVLLDTLPANHAAMLDEVYVQFVHPIILTGTLSSMTLGRIQAAMGHMLQAYHSLLRRCPKLRYVNSGFYSCMMPVQEAVGDGPKGAASRL